MLACRSQRAMSARFGLVASLCLAAGGAPAQDHYDIAGTRIPAFVLLDGCLSEGACAGPNSASNPLFVNPAQSSTVGDGVVTGGVATFAVASGGTAYVAGDVGKTVAVVGGTFTTQAQATIASVAGGAVTGVTLANSGVYSVTPAQPQATTGGGTTGSGLTLTLGFAPIAQTLFGGVAPVNGWKINNPNAAGDLWASDDGVAPTANGPSSYRVPAGGGGQFATEPHERPPGSPVQLLGAAIGAPFIARRW
jgi:hypothetical protein